MISRQRKRELDERYAKAIRGADRETTRHEWNKYLADLYKEDGDLQIFISLRRGPRINGARVDNMLMVGEIDRREAFVLIREKCADLYVKKLNQYGLADIDLGSGVYRSITREMALQVIHAFKGIDPTDKTVVCTNMAKTWHQFVKLLHNAYGLPSVRLIQGRTSPESDAEDSVLIADEFETKMTPGERSILESEIDAVRPAGL